MGEIKSKEWYDFAYTKSTEYAKPYFETFYYPLWQKVFQLITASPILEVGCGSGQFAEMLLDRGLKQYHGFDFSRAAVKIAKYKSKQSFEIADALTPDPYKGDYKTVIIMEVLEHTDDEKILSFIPIGKEIILTVPDFDYPSHIRFFETEESVRARYEKFMDILHYEKIDKWHIVKGIKK